MAETGKKVEVRYGAFACRVEGFDDPVAPLREVLSLMQRVIAETPALADQRLPLTEAQFARIGEALAHRANGGAVEGETPGLIVIRSDEGATEHDEAPPRPVGGNRFDDDVEDGAAPPPGHAHPDSPGQPPRREARPSTRDPDPADAGPQAAAAIHAAPAAAAAEAAFAASVAAGAGDGIDAQGPLGTEEPGDRATPAALFAAPAAGIAEAGFPDRFAAAARPADADDDAGDPDLGWADEAADERAPPADDGATPAGRAAAPPEPGPQGSAAAPGRPTTRSGRGDDDAGPRHADPTRAEPARAGPDGAEHAPALGGPGDAWSPWQSGGAARPGAPGADAAPLPSGSGHGNWPGSAGEGGAAHAFREPAPGYRDAKDEALPAINIFAPPPPDAPAARAAEADPSSAVAAEPQPPAAPFRRAPSAADDAEIVTVAGEAPRQRRASPPDQDADDLPEDGAGDWPDGDDDTDAAGLDAEPTDSAENRLAALITRYQSGTREHAAHEAEPAIAAGSFSAAELAERAEATEVEDLLAVSAAWLTLSEGRSRFTRREVMEVFETLPGRHLRTLEARIKGFGSLVRSGTLRLADEGAFSLAPRERARFRALVDQG